MFTTALSNVLLTLMYIIPGYAMCKSKKVKADHMSSLSAILIYILSPCMIIHSFISLKYSSENLLNMGIFFITTLCLQAAFMAILYAVLHKKYEDARYRLVTIGCVLGNVGFFGLPIVKELLPNNPEVASYSCIFVVSMNLLVFTMGVFCLTNDSKYMTLGSALKNPSSIAFYIALPLYIFGAGQHIPELVMRALELLAKMTTPTCMIILGIRLATVPFKSLFTKPAVYAVCIGKLLVFPLFCFACTYFLPLPFSFKASILILSSAPSASVILNLAEMHHSETELSANCVLLTTMLCFLTIPLLVMLL